jgi:hypothetical protein
MAVCLKCCKRADETQIRSILTERQTAEQVVNKDVPRLAKEIKAKKKSDEKDGQKVFRLLTVSVNSLETILHAHNTTLMRARNSVALKCLDYQQWEPALHFYIQTLATYDLVFPPTHPLVGIQYLLCGKLQVILFTLCASFYISSLFHVLTLFFHVSFICNKSFLWPPLPRLFKLSL